MKCKDIVALLEKQSPSEYALDWDNVGLLVGRNDKEVKRIIVALDATREVIKKAVDVKADMIVTHHPMIFSKINRVNDRSVLGDKIMTLVESGIACYAMHTNFDTKGGMAKLAADMLSLKNQEVLEETKDGEGIGKIGLLDKPMTVRKLGIVTKEKFGLDNVMIYGDMDRIVEKIAISPGSGKSMIKISREKNVECLITGDIGHHEGIDAVEMGVLIIDASHYGIEKIFMEYICKYLKDFDSSLEIEMIDVGVPYNVI